MEQDNYLFYFFFKKKEIKTKLSLLLAMEEQNKQDKKNDHRKQKKISTIQIFLSEKKPDNIFCINKEIFTEFFTLCLA